VQNVIDASELRLHELGAVLRVMQEEVEHAFVSTASTIRGVRAGAESFKQNGGMLRGADDLEDEGLDDLDEYEVDEDDDESLQAIDELEIVEAEFDDESDIDTIDDLDAADDAAEDMTNVDDNGPAFGRAEPRIKRTRRSDRG
jgi:hypothetical protein